MRGCQNAAICAIDQRLMILSVLAGENGEVFGAPVQQIEQLVAVTRAILEAGDVAMVGQPQHRLVAKIDAGPVGDVVEHDRMRGAIRKRTEMKPEALLRRPRVVWAGNQVAVDRPCRGSVQRVQQCAGVAAGQAKAERKLLERADFVADREYKPFGFLAREGEAFARCGGENQSIDGKIGIMPRQPAQRRLVELAIAKRRDQRQPEAMQGKLKIGKLKIGNLKIGKSKVGTSGIGKSKTGSSRVGGSKLSHGPSPVG